MQKLLAYMDVKQLFGIHAKRQFTIMNVSQMKTYRNTALTRNLH